MTWSALLPSGVMVWTSFLRWRHSEILIHPRQPITYVTIPCQMLVRMLRQLQQWRFNRGILQCCCGLLLLNSDSFSRDKKKEFLLALHSQKEFITPTRCSVLTLSVCTSLFSPSVCQSVTLTRVMTINSSLLPSKSTLGDSVSYFQSMSWIVIRYRQKDALHRNWSRVSTCISYNHNVSICQYECVSTRHGFRWLYICYTKLCPP